MMFKANSMSVVAAVCLLAQTHGALAADGVYEGGRGLLTLEGPSGMFINPTSGTMPQDAATLQYCIIFPENKTDVVGHGLMAAYGVSDALEIGASGNYIDLREADDSFAGGGPLVRYRLTKDEGVMPQIGIGGYSRFGDDELDKYAAFIAAYKRLPISDDGLVRALGVHVGAKSLWVDDDVNPDDQTTSGYAGAELQLPLRLYLVGEVQTKDDDFNAHTPYAFGAQWRAAGIAMSMAGIQDGSFDDPSFFYGIGYSGSM